MNAQPANAEKCCFRVLFEKARKELSNDVKRSASREREVGNNAVWILRKTLKSKQCLAQRKPFLQRRHVKHTLNTHKKQ